MATNDQTVRGFNAGYIIEKYLPKLSTTLRKSLQNSESEFLQAFVAGAEEMQQERARLKMLSKMRNTSSKLPKSRDKDRDIER